MTGGGLTMKKFHTLIAAAVLVLCVALTARAEKQSYTFGVFWDQNAKQTASYNTLAKDVAKAISLDGEIRLSNIYYNNLDQFHEDLTTRKVDFIYANTEEDFLLATMYGYRPFASISIFGKDRASHCLYVGKDSEIQDVKGLAGKSLITYPYQNAYSLLRKLVQAPPETYFGAIETGTDAFKSVDDLANGKVDAIFLVETNIDFFENVNPGPLKKIRRLACAEAMPFMPLMAAPAVSDEALSSMEHFYDDIYTNEILSKYVPFFKQVKFKVYRINEEAYQPLFDLYEFTLTNGWDVDFDNWMNPGLKDSQE